MVNTSVAEIMAEIEAGIRADKEEIRSEVRAKAREMSSYARSIAPIYHGAARPDVKPGAFQESIHDEDAPDHDGLPAARVISPSPIAHLLEFGTKTMPETATFAKTAAQFGGTGPDNIGAGT